MTTSGEYPAEEYLGSDSSGRNDAARDEADRLNPDFEEDLEGDDDLRPDSMVDLTELDEVGRCSKTPSSVASSRGRRMTLTGSGRRPVHQSTTRVRVGTSTPPWRRAAARRSDAAGPPQRVAPRRASPAATTELISSANDGHNARGRSWPMPE